MANALEAITELELLGKPECTSSASELVLSAETAVPGVEINVIWTQLEWF